MIFFLNWNSNTNRLSPACHSLCAFWDPPRQATPPPVKVLPIPRWWWWWSWWWCWWWSWCSRWSWSWSSCSNPRKGSNRINTECCQYISLFIIVITIFILYDQNLWSPLYHCQYILLFIITISIFHLSLIFMIKTSGLHCARNVPKQQACQHTLEPPHRARTKDKISQMNILILFHIPLPVPYSAS